MSVNLQQLSFRHNNTTIVQVQQAMFKLLSGFMQLQFWALEVITKPVPVKMAHKKNSCQNKEPAICNKKTLYLVTLWSVSSLSNRYTALPVLAVIQSGLLDLMYCDRQGLLSTRWKCCPVHRIACPLSRPSYSWKLWSWWLCFSWCLIDSVYVKFLKFFTQVTNLKCWCFASNFIHQNCFRGPLSCTNLA